VISNLNQDYKVVKLLKSVEIITTCASAQHLNSPRFSPSSPISNLSLDFVVSLFPLPHIPLVLSLASFAAHTVALLGVRSCKNSPTCSCP
jgi:hypothetical protein